MSGARLKKNQDRRLRSGHPWVFSNEIDEYIGPVEDGDILDVLDHRGAFLGRGYVNRRSLIAIRLLTRGRDEIDAAFFARRFERAVAYREGLYPGDDAWRVVNAEGDGMPGLVVDRYGDVLSVGIQTLGMDQRRETIMAQLQELFRPKTIVLRADSPFRKLEGLELERRVWSGDEKARPLVTVGGLRYVVDPLEGQKTGLFLDQRDNRRRLQGRVAHRGVLDVYSNTGAWAMAALGYGATEATLVESSRPALDLAEENLRANDLLGRARLVHGDAFDFLEELGRARERFAAVVVDPPALVKKRSQLAQGLRAYKEINRRAMLLLEEGGWLFSSSCSHPVSQEDLRQTLAQAAREAKRPFRLVEWGFQSADHPVLLAAPETAYLKCAVLRAF
ncbi:MAG TPA: class I SAM-dependent rRNA methyltransferase [Candidatus Eisenbacteria bacterium]|nr:class I SAM-dependent rRNA methyltransferase [Candidatus Eisenbacteria bacterium]